MLDDEQREARGLSLKNALVRIEPPRSRKVRLGHVIPHARAATTMPKRTTLGAKVLLARFLFRRRERGAHFCCNGPSDWIAIVADTVHVGVLLSRVGHVGTVVGGVEDPVAVAVRIACFAQPVTIQIRLSRIENGRDSSLLLMVFRTPQARRILRVTFLRAATGGCSSRIRLTHPFGSVDGELHLAWF